MTPAELYDRRLTDLRRFAEMLRSRVVFRAIKFNDGEWHAMTGRGGTNCDNHHYSQRLLTDMRRAYAELKESSWISDYIVNHCAYDIHKHYANKAGRPEKWFVNFAMLHDNPYKSEFVRLVPELREFYRAIREDERPKIFIGPKRLQPESFLNTTDRIDVPMLDAYDNIDALIDQAKKAAKKYPDGIFLLACGFCSCIIARKIAPLGVTVIDLGSALDPLLFGKTRKSQMPQDDLREFYSDFGVDWPVMPHYHDEIPGWFNFPDLYADMVERFDDGLFVEVGSWHGKSAAFMGVEIQRSGKPIALDCVDHFKGSANERSKNHAIAAKVNVKGRCANNLRPFWSTALNDDYTKRVDNMLRIVPMESLKAAATYADESIDFCFIDAGHTESEVEADINEWLPKVKKGGILAGHDYSKSFPGVMAAVDRILPERKLVSSNCWLIER